MMALYRGINISHRVIYKVFKIENFHLFSQEKLMNEILLSFYEKRLFRKLKLNGYLNRKNLSDLFHDKSNQNLH